MNRDKISSVVIAMYSARVNNDVAGCRSCFSSDATLMLAGGDEAVYQAENSIPPTVDEQIQALVNAWRWIAIGDQRILIDGNKVAVMYELETEFRPTGDVIRTQISDHILIGEDGKIAEFVEFVDTALVQSLAAKAT